MGRALCVFLLGFNACHHAPNRPNPVSPNPDQVAEFNSAAERAESRTDGGWVVSWSGDIAQNQGDSLTWTAAQLASTPCSRGRELEGAILAMMNQLHGGLWRHPSQADKISLDGAVLAYRAIARRVVRCGEADTWRPVFALHMTELAAHGGRLNPAADVYLEPGWQVLPELLGAQLGLRAAPPAVDLEALEHLVAGWAGLVKLAHATGQGSDACFRIHIGLEALQTIEELGHQVGAAGRDDFCANTQGMDLPTTNQWCGRGGLKSYLDTFKENEWQFRHQRCQWESADGDGWWQPGIDHTRGLADYYGL